MIVIDNKFDLGQTVYLKTDKEQNERMITGIMQRPIGTLYVIQCGTTDSWHYECEISVEKNVLIVTTN